MPRRYPIAAYVLWLGTACLAAPLLLACSGSFETPKVLGKHSATDEQMYLSDSIEKNYDPHVIMKRAEAFYEEEAYPEAIVEYQHFLDMHRQHVLAPYARYKHGESHFNMASTIDRDPEPIKKAQDSLEALLRDYPGSKYETDALVKIRECRNWLARVNFFVGQFYYKRGSYLAAAHRFEDILKEETDLEVEPDALYYLAMSYKGLGADDWALEQLVILAQKYPSGKYAGKTEDLFAELNATLPPDAFAQAPPQTIEGIGVPVNSLSANSNPPAFSAGLDASPAALSQQAITPTTITHTAPALSSSSRISPKPCRLGTWC